ncbi:MAG: carbohydrate ABC transporter permease, partial [Candidatus Acidiferrales bacterium]
MAPIAWHLVSSLKSPAELTSIPPIIWPGSATLDNYRELFTRRAFGRYYANSFVIAALSSLLCVLASALVAYKLARE